MPKPLFIAISDLHLHDWDTYNENGYRTNQQIKAINEIVIKANKLDVPILMGGDLMHQKRHISNGLSGFLPKLELVLSNCRRGFYGIDGNHDMVDAVRGPGSTGGFVSTIGPLLGITCINFKSIRVKSSGGEFMVHGIPYIEYNVGLFNYISKIKLERGKRHVLLIHTDLPSVKDTDGREVASYSNVPNDWKTIISGFDIVLAGHIHQPQRIAKTNAYSIGAPYHQRVTDIDSNLGYYICYSDFRMEHVYLKGYPEFKVDHGNGRDDFNFWIDGTSTVTDNSPSYYIKQRKFSKMDLVKGYCKINKVSNKRKNKLINLILG